VAAVVTVVAVLDVCVVWKSAWRRRRMRRRGCGWRLLRRWLLWWPGCAVRYGEGGLAARTGGPYGRGARGLEREK